MKKKIVWLAMGCLMIATLSLISCTPVPEEEEEVVKEEVVAEEEAAVEEEEEIVKEEVVVEEEAAVEEEEEIVKEEVVAEEEVAPEKGQLSYSFKLICEQKIRMDDVEIILFGPVVRRATTNEFGELAFRNLPFGSYGCWAVKDGFSPTTLIGSGGVLIPGERYTFSGEESIQIRMKLIQMDLYTKRIVEVKRGESVTLAVTVPHLLLKDPEELEISGYVEYIDPKFFAEVAEMARYQLPEGTTDVINLVFDPPKIPATLSATTNLTISVNPDTLPGFYMVSLRKPAILLVVTE